MSLIISCLNFGILFLTYSGIQYCCFGILFYTINLFTGVYIIKNEVRGAKTVKTKNLHTTAINAKPCLKII